MTDEKAQRRQERRERLAREQAARIADSTARRAELAALLAEHGLMTLREAADVLGYGGVVPEAAVMKRIKRGLLTAVPYPEDWPRVHGYYPGRQLVSRAEVEAERERQQRDLEERRDRAERSAQRSQTRLTALQKP